MGLAGKYTAPAKATPAKAQDNPIMMTNLDFHIVRFISSG
jgi:hypothetical protein